MAIYKKISDLPTKVTESLPKGGQRIYLVTFNIVWREKLGLPEEERELAAHTAAWRAVEREYKKDKSGLWKKL